MTAELPRPTGDGDPQPAPAELFARLFDDAAMFPPAALPVRAALAGHLRHRSGPHAGLVGPFVCSDAGLADLAAALDRTDADCLDLSLTVPGGPTALPSALAEVARQARLRLVSVELPVPAADVPRVADLLTGLLPAGVTAFVEVAPAAEQERHAAYRVLAATGHRLKVRTGGTVAAAFPGTGQLAAVLADCARLGLAFKCTAGLHGAAPHVDPATGFAHHGFLAVLLATDEALTGAGTGRVGDVLALRDPAELGARARALPRQRAAAVRAAFTSFGTCSVDEPVDDLAALALLPRSVAARP